MDSKSGLTRAPLDLLTDQGELGRADATAREYVKSQLREFVAQVLDGTIAVAANTEMMISARVAQIDDLLSLQLNEIMHHPSFQKLEGSWRGLKYLVDNSETRTMVKIRVLSCNKKELLQDLHQAPRFSQSALFTKVYEEVYRVFGAAPFGALLGDYEFGAQPEDIELLELISHVAAAAHAPFISAVPSDAASDMLTTTRREIYLWVQTSLKVCDESKHAKWRRFRRSEDARYVALCLPRVLGRLPYVRDSKPVGAFVYIESVEGTDRSRYLWTNAAYAFGTRLANAFSTYGLCVAICGHEGGGRADGLPVHIFSTDEGTVYMKTEVSISERREVELGRLGFIPLLEGHRNEPALFFGSQSCQQPKVYDTEFATHVARLSAQLPYVMACSRFAHYLMVIARDKAGGFASPPDCERSLNGWVQRYARMPYSGPLNPLLPDESECVMAGEWLTKVDGSAVDAAHPLAKALIQVKGIEAEETGAKPDRSGGLSCGCPSLRRRAVDIPTQESSSRPSNYRAVAWLRPRFQLAEPVTLSIVVDVPPPVRG